jgi:hypothetical protein
MSIARTVRILDAQFEIAFDVFFLKFKISENPFETSQEVRETLFHLSFNPES